MHAAFAGTIPFVIGAWEFGKRILIQLRCETCGGNGLIPVSGRKHVDTRPFQQASRADGHPLPC